jgi:hypothetical protein
MNSLRSREEPDTLGVETLDFLIVREATGSAVKQMAAAMYFSGRLMVVRCLVVVVALFMVESIVRCAMCCSSFNRLSQHNKRGSRMMMQKVVVSREFHLPCLGGSAATTAVKS